MDTGSDLPKFLAMFGLKSGEDTAAEVQTVQSVSPAALVEQPLYVLKHAHK